MKKCKQCGIYRDFALFYDDRFNMCRRCYEAI